MTSPLPTITVDDVLRWDPCYEDARERIESVVGEDARMNALEILDLEDFSIEDRLWVVLRPELIDERTLRLFACDCAERSLLVYERAYPEDPRPRKSLEVSRAYAEGRASQNDLRDARAAARDALAVAREAARSARDARGVEWAAAWSAALAGSWVAAWQAARDAARHTAREAALAAARHAARDVARDAALAAARSARDAVWDTEQAAAWEAKQAAEQAVSCYSQHDAWDAELLWQLNRLKEYLR